jgi:transposase
MKKFTSFDIKESLSELKSLYRKEKNYRIRTRLQSLILVKEGKFKKRTELARYLGVDYATLKRWTQEYKDSGLQEFLKIKSGGNRRAIITKEMHQTIKNKLHDSNDPLLGYFDAVHWLKEEHGVSVKYHTLRAYMIRHFKTKLKSPRKSHYKKDEQAIEAFKKTTGAIERD